MPKISYSQVKRVRIAPDGVHVTFPRSIEVVYQAEDLEFEMPNGDIVDIDQLIEAINLKDYVSKRQGGDSL